MPGSRSTALVTAVGLVLAAGPAWAHPRVMVWPGAPEAPVREAEQYLQGQGVPLVPHAAARARVEGHRQHESERDRQAREAVEARLDTARDQYLELELDEMVETLDDAEPEALALSRPGRCDGLWALQFQRGLAHATRGRDDDADGARARYALALELDPERRPLHTVFGPDVTAGFLAAVEERGRRVPRVLPVRVQPPDARVEVDCRRVEASEASLRPGLHAVRVSAPGHRPWSAVIDSTERRAIEVTLVALPTDDDPALRIAVSTDDDAVDDGSSSARAAVLSLARSEGAAVVMVVGPAPDGWRVRPWGRDAIGAPVERAQLSTALEAALRLVDDEGHLVVPAPVAGGDVALADPASEPARRPVVRTWWFWTLVGTVVATGAAVGLGVGLSRRQAPSGRLVIVAR